VDSDLKVCTDITEENRMDQRSYSLAWFWRLEGQDTNTGNAWMEEGNILLIVP
jgi:hypothetical protein